MALASRYGGSREADGIGPCALSIRHSAVGSVSNAVARPAVLTDFRLWFGSAMGFFLAASVFGLLMRYMFVGEVTGVRYRNILHAHSHVALMGWAYQLLSGALVARLVPDSERTRSYHLFFWLNILATLGMAVSFPIQGYGAASISFSVLHVVASYGFAFLFLLDMRGKKDHEHLLARLAVIWMLVASIGLWAVGPLGAMLGRLHPVYFMAIQFFLHFQLNGWLTFGVLALLVQHVKLHEPEFRISQSAMTLLVISLFLTYFLSVTWSTPVPALFYVNSLGVILQAVAVYLMARPLWRSSVRHIDLRDWRHWVLMAGVACFAGKVLIHLAVALPVVAVMSYTIKNYVIGFIHLVVIGSVTLSVGGILLQQGLIPTGGRSSVGWLMLACTFGLTEALLFGQGTLLWAEAGFIPSYHLLLFLVSALFPVAIALILSGFLNRTSQTSANINQRNNNPIQSLT